MKFRKDLFDEFNLDNNIYFGNCKIGKIFANKSLIDDKYYVF